MKENTIWARGGATYILHRTSITICDAIDFNRGTVRYACHASSGSGPTHQLFPIAWYANLRKYVHIEYMRLAMHCQGSYKKRKCVLFLPTVVITREAQYFLACLGSTERFVQNEIKTSLPLTNALTASSCFTVKAKSPIAFATVEKSSLS